jgi:hypothetical protein
MAVKADYWDCAATVSACFAKLQKILTSAEFTGDHLTLMLTLLPEQVCFMHACSTRKLPLHLLLFKDVAVLYLHLRSCYPSWEPSWRGPARC